ncbi:MAG: hypothetical protein U1E05_00035 [Patescibacteria group bacterium]|nr:hypothetical protein [Patescibacteria group bacterium]
MSVLDRKLRRELRASWGMLLAIVSIIAVGVACFVAMGSSYGNLKRAKQTYYAQCRMPDFWMDVKKVPLAELDALAAMPGVGAIRPRIRFAATVSLADVVKPLNAVVLSMPDRREPVLADIVLRQGGYFTDQRENEVIVNEAFARHHRLMPGDSIHLLLNNRRQELQIVGTAIASEFTYLLGPGALVPDPKHFGVFYVKSTYAEDAFDFSGAANEILIQTARKSTPVAQRPRDAESHCTPDLGPFNVQAAERMLEPYGVLATTPLAEQVSNQFLAQEIDGLRVFALFMPTIFLAVAAMVLNVLLSRDGSAREQAVTLGLINDLAAEVVSGLEAGEMVVDMPDGTLTEGVRVTVNQEAG